MVLMWYGLLKDGYDKAHSSCVKELLKTPPKENIR